MGYNNQLHKKSTSKSRIYIMNKKWLVVGVVVVVLLIGGVVGGWVYNSSKKSSNPPMTQQELDAQKAFDTKQALDTKANNGDVKGALDGYNKAISDTSDTISKRNLLMSQTIVALDDNKLDEALVAVKAADKIKSDYNSLGLVAKVYDKMGNTKKAIEYYQKAANAEGESNFEKPLYEARAAELQRSIK